MDRSFLDTTWIWHPDWQDHGVNTAGRLVHFRKTIDLTTVPSAPLTIQITADTRYKLFVNSHCLITGPVKGDEHLWFYDEVDIQPFLTQGLNRISIRVLRFFHATPYATSFPRLSFPGLFVRTPAPSQDHAALALQSDASWECAIDHTTVLRVDQKEDDFLHIYEDVDASKVSLLDWVPAQPLDLPTSHGLTPPWILTPRMIPVPESVPVRPAAIHNLRSPIDYATWEQIVLGLSGPLRLPAGTSHHIEIEAEHHLTAHITFRFRRPEHAGSVLRIRYSEAYEDEPEFVPYIRRKGDRADFSKALYGPEDRYVFAGRLGAQSSADLGYEPDSNAFEVFSPFHFRTLRYMSIDIDVAQNSDLDLVGIGTDEFHYPLDDKSGFDIPSPTEHETTYGSIWATSVRTLRNCMHDCYEDCPFYEQLQYAMDVRSSCLFTYALSGDDRMARQAIVQLHNSYRPSLGLIASRSPSHQLQVIPHFSLFWVCTVADHYLHYGDGSFTRAFLSTCDGILNSFARRLNPDTGLLSSSLEAIQTHWDFVDWTDEWRPMGIPTASQRTGTQTFTNFIYAYTLQTIAETVSHLGRPGLAAEYRLRAREIIQATRKHCWLHFAFTDGLAAKADQLLDFSQHNQIWAVLCGAIDGEEARTLLGRCLLDATWDSGVTFDTAHIPKFTKVSTAMSFYALRALSAAGGTLYDQAFHAFWNPWRVQLSQNLTTWCEDEVTLRSDCHAWSSVPLYEFMAEVAGVRPLEPGWTTIACAPRVQLFRSFNAKVALGGRLAPGIACITWSREDGSKLGRISICLQDVSVDNPIRIRLTLPGHHSEEYGVHTISTIFQVE
ncbi:Putative six-hairpin glycosidase superfamily, alpha-L-rhamnosidase, six-hairpin glycosidase [Colletotrichum destructivum]|uniref:Six-hairpin glycosidase superfamily, alpha-L-rhamnosidase, six-hairpin glycosidase n=1 Tax=Colletotrichum destructivum TaxID=34406 RepID=A0AAX4I282_9PEZI|nr:Putative six-hairpin glycosidase superfamily, alpha-L-rhamnosidase, six-hairpin glycosidase [Colletotrichum destructivum]